MVDRLRYQSQRTSLLEPANLAAEFEQLKDTIEKLSSPRSAGDIDVFLGLSFDPSDESLSIDVTTEPVLEGEDLATLPTASTPETSPLSRSLPVFRLMMSISQLPMPQNFSTLTSPRLHAAIKNNELIGFRLFKNVLRIPREQFKNGDVVDGIADILSLFESQSAGGR